MPKPACRAMLSTGRSPDSSAMRALSTRAASTYAAGVMPVSRRKARAKLRSLIEARRASAGTERSSSRWSGIQAWSSRSGSRSASWAASWALNCAWPPGRFTNRTSQRAASSATPGRGPPRPARARGPSRGHARGGADVAVADEDRVRLDRDGRIALGEIGARGQWVVARRPSRRPARASRKAPVQTEVTRRERCAASPSQAISVSSPSARRVPVPPATIRVSIGLLHALRGWSGTIVTVDVRSGRSSSGAAIVTT